MKRYFAELLGTFILVLIGCGTAVFAGKQVGFLGISLAFGIAIIVIAYGIGHISGGHVNPAVTVGVWLSGKMAGKDVIPYILSQCIGAIVGAVTIWCISKGNSTYNLLKVGLGQNGYGVYSPSHYSLSSGMVFETIATFIFVLTILIATTTLNNGLAGFVIGITLAGIHILGIPITGVSVNPARSLGPALFAGDAALSQLWVFIIFPSIGSILAAVVYKTLFNNK